MAASIDMRNNRLVLILVAVVTAVFAVTLLLRQTAAAVPNSLSPLPTQPATTTTGPDEIRFMVSLAQKADLVSSLPEATTARRAEIINRLQATAVSSQQALTPLLRQLEAAGHISRIQPFWITNAIGVSGDAAAMQELAAHPAVKAVREEATFYLHQPSLHEVLTEPRLYAEASSPDTTAAAWGVNRVRAPFAWHGLGITGQGVTVAIMDSGVDWLHPDLNANYRGNLGNGQVQHAGNWYHAVDPTISEPVDLMGHGTHVAGTAVGQNGLGVAPGARWIAVAIANPDGSIFESAIHAGFEWLLAPSGDPALAPDVVNGSWGNMDPTWLALTDDLLALQSAGIVPVFSAGNGGPFPGTVGAPASYANILAVGASDDEDYLAWFSSRGPSPLTSLPKPHLVAPGARVFSAYPGGRYAYASGTSMAAPHVSGAVALLLAANPALAETVIWQRLAETAVPITATHPNNDSGWGRLDAYAAVLPEVTTGSIQGFVYQDGAPAPAAEVTLTNSSGYSFNLVSDGNGRFSLSLLPGQYGLQIAKFGAVPFTHPPINLAAGQNFTVHANLSSLPGGSVSGVVASAGSFQPIPAQITVSGTPVTAVANSQGRYNLSLPAGSYTLVASRNGHRLGQSTVTVTAGSSASRNFLLEPAPALLLVDAGRWYYNSQIAAYQAALAGSEYAADLLTIRDPFADVPASAELAPYDAVIWADPQAAPGYVGADGALSTYLLDGGNLLVSGQHVAWLDGSTLFASYWWISLLRGSFLGKFSEPVPPPVQGAAGTHFAGLNLQLQSSGSTAQNPDRTAPRSDSLSRTILHYPNGESAGLQGGLCQDFRIVYLGFGLEGVTTPNAGAELIQRSIAYFQSPRQEVALLWRSPDIDDYAIPGQDAVYDLTLLNLSELHTDTVHLTTGSTAWASSLLTPTLELGPCTAARTRLTVSVPPDMTKGMTHTVRVTAVSGLNSAISDTLIVQHQVPRQVLLVDDDRWYDYQAQYTMVLDALNLDYDVWETENTVTTLGRGSPPLDLLRQYDLVFWFTGYDWFRPVTPQERSSLETYLREGGRLFLSSQDYLYYNYDSSLTRNYLGVYTYQESITPTHVYAGLHLAVPDPLSGPYALDYNRARNNSDSILPAPQSRAIAWNEQGLGTAVATAHDAWRTIFWSLPFEFLADQVRLEAMHGMVGWLSDLGDSSFVADRRQAEPGEMRTFTLTVAMLASAPGGMVTITNPLPPGLEVVLSSLPPDVTYDAAARTLGWQGELNAGARKEIAYQAMLDPALPIGARLENRATLRYARHTLHFDRVATVWVSRPDLGAARLEADVEVNLPRQVVTYTLVLPNRSNTPADGTLTTLHLPPSLEVITGSLSLSGGTADFMPQGLVWKVDVPASGEERLVVALWRLADAREDYVAATAFIDDKATAPLVRTAVSYLPPYTRYFPLVFRQP